jgi:hypothetical protein
MNQPIPPVTQIKLDIDAKDVDGIYSNLAFLHLSASEFILDFARLMPGPPRAKVHSRIILTPQAAKAVMRLLQDNVKKYETEHGEIRLPGSVGGQTAIGFQAAFGGQGGDAGSSAP